MRVAVWFVYCASEGDPGSREREKDFVYPIGDGEKQKAKNIVQKEGAHDGTRTHVGMSKRLDLIT
jgi:hypothetical protein